MKSFIVRRPSDAMAFSMALVSLISYLELRMVITIDGYKEYYYGLPIPWWYDDSASSLDHEVYMSAAAVHLVFMAICLVVFFNIGNRLRISLSNTIRRIFLGITAVGLVGYLWTLAVTHQWHSGFVPAGDAGQIQYSIKYGPVLQKEAWKQK